MGVWFRKSRMGKRGGGGGGGGGEERRVILSRLLSLPLSNAVVFCMQFFPTTVNLLMVWQAIMTQLLSVCLCVCM